MEAFMVRFHPQWLRTREIANSGELGDIGAVRAVFSYHNVDPNNVRNKGDIGGGGLLGIGCYPTTAGLSFLRTHPQCVVSLVERDPNFRTDSQASVIADFGNGRHLTFLVSTQMVPDQSVEILGTKGRVELVIPFNAPQDLASALLVDSGYALDGSL